MTPIAYATMRNGIVVVKILLRAGASMEINRVSFICFYILMCNSSTSIDNCCYIN